jgi:hypothetical protein
MHLRHRERNAIAFPDLAQPCFQAAGAFEIAHPDGLGVDINIPAVPAGLETGIEIETMIEEAFARQIMVHPNLIRRRGTVGEALEFVGADAGAQQEGIEGMAGAHPAGQQVETQPPALIFVLRLVGKRRCGERLSDIFRLQEPRAGVDPTDFRHRFPRGSALVHDGAQERRIVRPMRIPVTIER